MKQHITPEQLNELSKQGMSKLRKWWKPQGYGFVYARGHGKIYTVLQYEAKKNTWPKDALPLLSIGQMIEFLDDVWADQFFKVNGKWIEDGMYFALSNEELCDALWEAVKEVLEKE